MRAFINCTIATALLAVCLTATADGQAADSGAAHDSVKIALIHDLLAETHAVDQGIATMEATLPAQKAAHPQIPAVFWDRFLLQARLRRGELEDLMVPAYERHFSRDELRQLVAFYQTPLGQKLQAVLPAVMSESMAAGQLWGQKIGATVVSQLTAEGVRIGP